jgi:hypothetical protein
MGVLKKVFGPKSKYDRSLPYTYYAKVPAIDGDDDVFIHYFADTVCGLIEYLDESGVTPGTARLYGAGVKEDLPLDAEACTTKDGKWLKRPEICRSLEDRYKKTLEKRYKGHVDKGKCSFEDRSREGGGPF